MSKCGLRPCQASLRNCASAAPTTPSRGPAETATRPGHCRAEGYRLVVTPDAIDLEASDVAGLRYGTVTLWQLAAGSAGTAGAPRFRPCASKTRPASRWRGLMLDSARHYQSPEFIERFIDWMALHKFNVLHWHLTDDQAWRLEIRTLPASHGGWRMARAGRSCGRSATSTRRRASPACTAASTRRTPCDASCATRPSAASPSCPRSRCRATPPRRRGLS